MRILLYVEPFPIRDSRTHLEGVFKRFRALLSSHPGFDIRMFANDKTYEAHGLNGRLTGSNCLLRSTHEEEQLFEEHLVPWQTEGISLWRKLMAGTGQITEDYLQILRRIWSVFPFDVIVHWGENGAVKCFVAEQSVTRIAMEQGCTRPPFPYSLVMDPFGTNGSGVVPSLNVADLREAVRGRPMPGRQTQQDFSMGMVNHHSEAHRRALPFEITARLRDADRIAFLPLQLFDDANLLRFSSYESLTAVVMDVVPKLAERGYTTLIKPHPASPYRAGAMLANANALSALMPWKDQVIWCEYPEPVPSNSLATIANLVITVNSSVGFESLYFDKSVVVLGDAVYKPKDLFPTLNQVLSDRFDRTTYLEGIGLLRNFMVGGYLQHGDLLRDTAAFMDRVGTIQQLCQGVPVNAPAFACGFWEAMNASGDQSSGPSQPDG